MSEHDERVEALAKVLLRQHEYALGIRRGSICTCGFVPTIDPGSLRSQQDYFVDHLAAEFADSPAMRDLLAAERAKALREAADESRVEWGVHYPGEREPRIGPDEQAVREWQTYWNTHRHPELAEAVVVSRVVTTTAWEADRIHPADPEETR